MDYVNKLTGGGNNNQEQGSATNNSQGEPSRENQDSSSGFLGSLGGKLNSAAGGGKEGEKNEDYLDKGMFLFIDYPCLSS